MQPVEVVWERRQVSVRPCDIPVPHNSRVALLSFIYNEQLFFTFCGYPLWTASLGCG